jgi:hypothetical protein
VIDARERASLLAEAPGAGLGDPATHAVKWDYRHRTDFYQFKAGGDPIAAG